MEVEIHLDQCDFDRAMQSAITESAKTPGDIDAITFGTFKASCRDDGEIVYCYKFDVTYKA